MLKKILIAAGIVIAIGLAAGGIYLLFFKDDTETTTTTPPPPPASTTDQKFVTTTGSYTITVKKTVGEKTTVSRVEVKDNDTYRVVADTSNSEAEIISDGSNIFVKDSTGTWYKYASSSQSTQTASVKAFTGFLQNEQLETLYATADSNGTTECITGTCNVFTYNDSTNNSIVTLKVDSKTNRLMEIKSVDSDDGSTSTVTYDYDTEVVIEIPTDAKEPTATQ